MERLSGECPALLATSNQADQAYGDSHTSHQLQCAAFLTGVENYQSIANDVRLELEQRNSEYDVLQQVNCYITAITSATEEAELTEGTCPGTVHNHFSLNFQTVPDSPDCLQGDGGLTGTGEAEAFDYTGSTCSSNGPYCNGNCAQCITAPAGQLHFNSYRPGNGWYWQVVTDMPEYFIRFSLQNAAAPAFTITYSDDGETWQTAGQFDSTPNPDVSWAGVGAHRYWRYNIHDHRNDAGHGHWFVGLQFYTGGWVVDHGNPTREYSNADVPGPWTLILQYGNEAYPKTAGAVGIPDELEAGFKKLSDDEINALPGGGNDAANWNYYWLTSDANVGENQDIRPEVLLRMAASTAYDDTALVSFSNAQWCNSAPSGFESPDLCQGWANAGGIMDLDTNGGGNACGRWFQGHSNRGCYNPVSEDRCYSSGHTCTNNLGQTSHPPRLNVKIYKFTALTD